MTGERTPRATAASTGRDVAGWLSLSQAAARSWVAIPAESDRRELLEIGAGDGRYAIAIERVREIVRVGSITRVPRTPSWLVGVVALRGEIVEVVDLRQRLGLPRAPIGRASRIVVLHGEREGVAAILVDSVMGVLRVHEDAVLPAPEYEFRAVVEMVRTDDRFVGVLDLARILHAGEVDA